MAWYPSVYAPRTGGAYDSHHRTAGIAGCGAAAAWPLADRMRRIGVLMNRAADNPEGQTRLAAFTQGLQEAGWAVGRNVRIELRWGAGDTERYRCHAAELVPLAPESC